VSRRGRRAHVKRMTTDTATPMTSEQTIEDYARVRAALAFCTERWRDQPPLERIAAEVGLSPAHFQRLFTRWAGLSPKAFLQAITLDHAKAMLEASESVLDTAYEVGLSGPGRLHDLFVTHAAMSPGEYKARGAGLEIRFGWHASPFGHALVMATPRGLAGLAFADEGGRDICFADMARRWPHADFVEDAAATAPYAARAFDPARWGPETPLRVHLIGSDFEVRVWETLLRVPMGRATTYGAIAAHIERPKAHRAVGTAVGRNPIAFVVPCHRVLGKGGSLCGYHWGLTRKQAILGWEAGKLAA
jgi:AraC family transcriptional regulator, regulatory protein of adaptative response / methylated-DNA-[protein]-cysteine methyltransferase